MLKRVETLSHPGTEEAGQAHAGRTAFGAACPATDFARDDQRTHTALSQIVVGRYARDGDKDRQLWQKPLHALAERLLGTGCET